MLYTDPETGELVVSMRRDPDAAAGRPTDGTCEAMRAKPRLTFGLTGREAITIEVPLPLAGELLANGGILRLDLEARAALSAMVKHERAEVQRLERERTAEMLERRLP